MPTKPHLFALLAMIAAGEAILSGCGGGTSSSGVRPASDQPGSSSTGSPGSLITDNITRSAAPATLLTTSADRVVLLNHKGFDVVANEIGQAAGWQDGLDYYLYDSILTPEVVGAGDSGSPVAIPNSNGGFDIAAVLFAGYSGDNKHFLAHDVQSMFSISRAVVQDPASHNDKAFGLSYQVSGVSQQRWNRMVANDKSGTLAQFHLINEAPRVATSRAEASVPPPIAGRSLAVNLLRGDVSNLYAVGTFTILQNNRWLVFGHPLYWDGKTSWPVSMAYVDAMITDNGYQDSFKLAHPVGPNMGILTQDRYNGCSVKWNINLVTSPLTTVYYLPQGTAPFVSYHHELTRMGGGYFEDIALRSGLVYSLDRARDRVSAGSAHVKLDLTVNTGTARISKTFEEDIQDSYDLTTAIDDFVTTSRSSLVDPNGDGGFVGTPASPTAGATLSATLTVWEQ
jgi:hypothetical protein